MGKEDMEGLRATVNNPEERASQMLAGDAEFARQESDEKAEKAAEESRKVDQHIADLTGEMRELDKQIAIAEAKMAEIKEKMSQGAKVESGNPALKKIHASVQSELNNERLTWFDQVEQLKGQKIGAETAREYWEKVKRGEITPTQK